MEGLTATKNNWLGISSYALDMYMSRVNNLKSKSPAVHFNTKTGNVFFETLNRHNMNFMLPVMASDALLRSIYAKTKETLIDKPDTTLTTELLMRHGKYIACKYEKAGRIMFGVGVKPTAISNKLCRWFCANSLSAYTPKINDTFIFPAGIEYMYYLDKVGTHVLVNPCCNIKLSKIVKPYMVSFLNIPETYCILKNGYDIERVVAET